MGTSSSSQVSYEAHYAYIDIFFFICSVTETEVQPLHGQLAELESEISEMVNMIFSHA